MLDKKPTDSEIVKALKSRMYKENKYMFSLLQETLDLINRQKAEINHLENESDALRADIDFLDRENDKLQAANERLEITVNSYKKMYEDIQHLEMKVDKIKAEAYKEFVEKLHKELRIYGIKDKFNKSVFLNVVDKAKKELVGDK